jgi:serine/threonine-protein kinase
MSRSVTVKKSMNESSFLSRTLVDRLEALWEQGGQPDPIAFLGDEKIDLGEAAAVAVLSADQWRRWQAGQRVAAEEYLRRCPALADNPDAAVDMIYGEFLIRDELGEAPTQQEFLDRFPQFANRLQAQFAMFEAMQDEASAPVAAGRSGSPATVHETNSGSAQPAWTNASTLDGRQEVGAIGSKFIEEGMFIPVPSVTGYEIVSELGRGGMGVVYKARHLKLNRLVALKMVLVGVHASQEQLLRFVGEAEMVAQLQHPNIVQLFDAGLHDGMPYLSMEFVEGGSLGKNVRDRLMPPAEAAKIVEALARGVDYAHSRGIVHRDLQPENVLLTNDGTPKITDFGLAKRTDVGDWLTRSGAIMGTPGYMSPEQARGNSNAVGPAADIYSLGAILFRLLTGRAPFQASTPMETLLRVMAREPPSPSQYQPLTPPELAAICLQCLQKAPEERYARALDLAEDLRLFQAGKPAVWHKPAPVEPRRDPREVLRVRGAIREKATRTQLLLGALLILLLGAATVIFYSKRSPQRIDNRPPPEVVAMAPSDDVDPNPPANRYALRFDGKSRVVIPDLPIDTSQPFTIEAYIVQFANNEGVQTPLYAIDQGICLDAGTYWKACLYGPDGWTTARSKDPIVCDRRFHVAAVFSETQIRIYVDGELSGYVQRDPVHLPAKSAAKFIIGDNFHGEIDEVRILKIERYKHKFTPPTRFKADPNTVALYHFDEKGSPKLIDSSGNQHDGTIEGAEWIEVRKNSEKFDRPPELGEQKK